MKKTTASLENLLTVDSEDFTQIRSTEPYFLSFPDETQNYILFSIDNPDLLEERYLKPLREMVLLADLNAAKQTALLSLIDQSLQIDAQSQSINLSIDFLKCIFADAATSELKYIYDFAEIKTQFLGYLLEYQLIRDDAQNNESEVSQAPSHTITKNYNPITPTIIYSRADSRAKNKSLFFNETEREPLEQGLPIKRKVKQREVEAKAKITTKNKTRTLAQTVAGQCPILEDVRELDVGTESEAAEPFFLQEMAQEALLQQMMQEAIPPQPGYISYKQLYEKRAQKGDETSRFYRIWGEKDYLVMHINKLSSPSVQDVARIYLNALRKIYHKTPTEDFYLYVQESNTFTTDKYAHNIKISVAFLIRILNQTTLSDNQSSYTFSEIKTIYKNYLIGKQIGKTTENNIPSKRHKSSRAANTSSTIASGSLFSATNQRNAVTAVLNNRMPLEALLSPTIKKHLSEDL